MGGVYSRYWIITSIVIGLINHGPYYLYAQPSWVVDERHITQSWPYSTITWIKQHAPPMQIQNQLDELLAQEAIIKILSTIYTYYYLNNQEKEILAQAGFTFLGGKLNIFEVKSIPGYVLKMAAPRNGHSELLNLGRIALADTLRANVRTWGMRSFLTIPKKYAYIVPAFCDIAYKDQPKVIIIAEKIPGFKNKRKLRSIIARAWLMIRRVPDLRTRNMQFSRNGLALIDTEPWRNALVPGFTNIITVIPRPSRNAHEFDERAYMPEFCAEMPKQKHGFSGKWHCITPQGMIVESPYLRCITCWSKKERR